MSGFNLESYIRERALAAGAPPEVVEAEAAWAREYAAETPEETIARVKRQSIRSHPFEGDGPHCQARVSFEPIGSAETGFITGWSGCGYPRDLHPGLDK